MSAATETPAAQVVRAPLLHTAEQAAVRLGVDDHGVPIKSARWLLAEARAGHIPCTRLGGTWCWSERNLLDLLAENYCDPARHGRKPAHKRGA